ncbi:MAG TPA: TraB/VirB10 family protein [Thiobacillaceae bacterium]|nr:TraB/VirB10 family protein [Thiobacillaceae bacterium]
MILGGKNDQTGRGARPMLSAAAAAIRRRQALIAGGVLIVVGLGLIGLVAFMRAGKSQTGAGLPEKPVPLAVAPAGAGVDPRDAWRGQEGTRIDRLERSVSELNDLMKRQEAEKQAASRLPAHLPGFPPGLPSGIPALPPPPPVKPASVVPLPPPISVPGQPAPLGVPPAKPELGIESGEMGPAPDVRPSNEPTAAKDRQAAKTPGTYLPSGSFVRAILLAGLNAPTGGQAQSNPHPVLLRLVDHAQLPNQFRLKAKDCLIVGSGYGDLSSERAYIRTESLSCVSPRGESLDLPIKGYVAGEDGKAGVMGRLITKQGQVLANALIAGIGSGLGQAFQQSATTTSTSPLGSTSTVKSGEEFKAGISSGVGKAMDRLAQYYISLAEKLYPVVEVDAGRLVDVVITKGAMLPMGEASADVPFETGKRYGAR